MNQNKERIHSFTQNGLFPLVKFLTILYAGRLLTPDLPEIVEKFLADNKAVRITLLVFASWVFDNDIITSVIVVLSLFFIVEGLNRLQIYIDELNIGKALKLQEYQRQQEKERIQKINESLGKNYNNNENEENNENKENEEKK